MTILVAEDYPAVMRILLARIMQIAPDATLLSAINVEAALLVAEGHQIDLLVTDYRMGPGDGVFLSQELRKLCPQVTIFLVSGSMYLDLYVVEAGAHRGFERPEGLDRLFLAIEDFVHHR